MSARDYPFGPPDLLRLHPLFARLRTEEPVSRVRLPYGQEGWLVTRYEDVRALICDPRFSRARAAGADVPRMTPLPGGAGSIAMMDAPEHTRMRRLVSRAFSLKRISELRPTMAVRAVRLLDEMVARGVAGDLMTDFAVPLALMTICDLLGVPYEDRHRFGTWIEVVMTTSGHSAEEVQEIMWDFSDYLQELVARRRTEPGEDLVSALVHVRGREHRPSEQELITFLGSTLTAGQDNVAKQIGNMAYLLLTDRSLFDRLRAQPDLIPSAVEEMLRYLISGPGVGIARIAKEDLEICGVLIREGDAVLGSFACANRDPAVFEEPEQIDLARDPNHHLAFGPGLHHCLGASLVRLELREALRALVGKVPRLRLAVPEQEVEWLTTSIAMGPAKLPVRW